MRFAYISLPFAIFWLSFSVPHYLSLFLAIFRYLSLFFAIFHYLSLSFTIFWLSFTISWLSFTIFWLSFAIFHNILLSQRFAYLSSKNDQNSLWYHINDFPPCEVIIIYSFCHRARLVLPTSRTIHAS